MENKQQKSLNNAIQQIMLGEAKEADNTAAVAKQVKQAVKKYVSGKLGVRSKGGKSRFIMIRADKIDNTLRKMVLDVVAPTANVRDKSDISYGNISDRIISASVEQWIKALGLKESVDELDEAPRQDIDKIKKVLKKIGVGFHTSKGKIMVNPKNVIRAGQALNKAFGGQFEKKTGMKVKGTEKVSISEGTQKREFEKGDVVVGRRGNFKGMEAVVVSIDPSGERLVVSITSKRKVRVNPSDWNKHPTGKRVRESVELDEAKVDGSKLATMGLSIDEFESLRQFALGKAGDVWKIRGKDFMKREIKGKLTMFTLLRGGQRDKNAKQWMDWIKKNTKHNVQVQFESVELDEALVLASDDLNAVKKTAQKLAKQSPDLTYYVVKHKIRHFRGKTIPYYEVYASEDWHIARADGAKKVVGYGANVKESVELDEAKN